MRKTVVFIFCFYLTLTGSLNVFSQDLIVTKSNDSIHCRIMGIRGNDMLYEYSDTAGINQSRISLGEMTFYHYGYFKNEKLIRGAAGYALPKIRVGFTGGYSLRSTKANASIPSNVASDINKRRSGFHYGGDITAYVSETIGIGIRVSGFRAVLKTEETESTSNRISIGYVGPSINFRFLDNTKKNFLNVAFSIGYTGYKNQIELDSYILKGNTLGYCFDLGYDFRLSQNWAFGIQISGLTGRIKNIVLSDGYDIGKIKLEKQNYERLSRIDLSVGLRCYL
jgi:hypothetical protein